jgi:hypothetical protein
MPGKRCVGLQHFYPFRNPVGIPISYPPDSGQQNEYDSKTQDQAHSDGPACSLHQFLLSILNRSFLRFMTLRDIYVDIVIFVEKHYWFFNIPWWEWFGSVGQLLRRALFPMKQPDN